MSKDNELTAMNDELSASIRDILDSAKRKVAKAVNFISHSKNIRHCLMN